MMEALGLDNMEEDNNISQQCSKSTFGPFKNMVSQIPPNLPAPRTTPIKHFYEAEMWAHIEKGIFYNCDEEFTQGHRCAEQNLYLLDVDSLPTLEIYDDAQDPVDDGDDIQQLLVDPPS